jgi:hypothetical protein
LQHFVARPPEVECRYAQITSIDYSGKQVPKPAEYCCLKEYNATRKKRLSDYRPAARSFENYVIVKMGKQGNQSFPQCQQTWRGSLPESCGLV